MSEVPSPLASTTVPAALYVNSVRIDYTRWDVTVDLMLITPAGDIPAEAGSETAYATERVTRVIMSPMHAKALAETSVRHSRRGRAGSARFPRMARDDRRPGNRSGSLLQRRHRLNISGRRGGDSAAGGPSDIGRGGAAARTRPGSGMAARRGSRTAPRTLGGTGCR